MTPAPFDELRVGPLVVRYDPVLAGPDPSWLGLPVEDLVAGARLEEVHRSRGAAVYRGAAPGRDGPALYWKEYVAWKRRDRVKDALRPSRARRAADGAALLEALGLEAPRTVAVGERRSGARLLERCFLVTEEVPGLRTLEEWSSEASLDAGARRRVLEGLGALVGRMHEGGVVHGDLRQFNVLCDPGAPRFVFLDNERTRRSRRTREVVRNLGQLAIDSYGGTRWTDPARFFRAYLRARPSLGDGGRELRRRTRDYVQRGRAMRAGKGHDPLTGRHPADPRQRALVELQATRRGEDP